MNNKPILRVEDPVTIESQQITKTDQEQMPDLQHAQELPPTLEQEPRIETQTSQSMGRLKEQSLPHPDTLHGQVRKTTPTQQIRVRDEMVTEIEKILESGMGDAFKELSPIQQQEFKIKGETTAYEIRDLMKKTKLKIHKIFSLIVSWLKLLPGVNKFFIEQEAKIKADKLISLHKRLNQRS